MFQCSELHDPNTATLVHQESHVLSFALTKISVICLNILLTAKLTQMKLWFSFMDYNDNDMSKQ